MSQNYVPKMEERLKQFWVQNNELEILKYYFSFSKVSKNQWALHCLNRSFDKRTALEIFDHLISMHIGGLSIGLPGFHLSSQETFLKHSTECFF